MFEYHPECNAYTQAIQHTLLVSKKTTDGGNLTVVLITGRKEFKGKEVGVGGVGGGGACVLDAHLPTPSPGNIMFISLINNSATR